MQYVENHPFYGHGLIPVGHSTYRCSVLRQNRIEHRHFEASLHRQLTASLKILILYLALRSWPTWIPGLPNHSDLTQKLPRMKQQQEQHRHHGNGPSFRGITHDSTRFQSTCSLRTIVLRSNQWERAVIFALRQIYCPVWHTGNWRWSYGKTVTLHAKVGQILRVIPTGDSQRILVSLLLLASDYPKTCSRPEWDSLEWEP